MTTSKLNPAVPSFESLFNLEEIQAIQNSFAAATGVGSIITDIEGNPITKPSNFCHLCKNIIRNSEKGRSNCMQSDAVIGRYHPDGAVIQPCLSGGLWDAGVSIHVAGKHIANWLVGQVRNEKTDIKQMLAYAQEIGVDKDEFAKALEEVTIMSLDQFENISRFLFLIANQLSNQAYQRFTQEKAVRKVTASESRLADYKIHLEGLVDIRNQALKASNDALKRVQATLEKTIEQRTDELKQKNEYLSALHETSLGMFTRLDLSQVLESIIKRASSLTRIPDGFVFIYNPEQGVLEIIAGCGNYSQLNGTKLFPEEGISGKVWESGEPLIVDDYQAWTGKSQSHCFDFVTSGLGVPLTSGSRVEGTIGLSHHDTGKRIDPENILILEQFAELATIAIDNSKLFESMREELDKRITLENERTEMEARLRQSRKMEAIGTLAGGIAHDFNNILFPILGFSEMVMHDLPEKSPVKNQLQSVHDSALRAKDLVQQILTFSRKSEQDYRPLKLQLIIKEVLKLARATFPATIKIIDDIPRDIGMVMADPTQIHQVAMNMITNALHSMEENGGELFVALEETVLTNDTLPDPEMVSGHYVCLTIADTGSGMDQEMVKRVFEPYFTTKVGGKGTGLGLAVVHGIVKNLKGEIIVHSGLGKGSKFLVYLPAIIKKNEDVDMKTRATAQLNGNERILVVDDEKAVLNIIEQVVSRFGYQVRSQEVSTEALKCFKNAPYEFDLVITDMTMPELTGDKLVVEIKKLRPEIPVILCTGFSEKIADGRAGAVKPDKILMKPVGMDDLLKNIRYLLDN